jgi:hypothetical protein
MLTIYDSPLSKRGEYGVAVSLGSGVNTGIITIPTLPVVPFACHLTVGCPTGGLHLTASVISDTLSNTGCQFKLSGLTTNTNYVLYATFKY